MTITDRITDMGTPPEPAESDEYWRDRYAKETGKDPDAILRPAAVAILIGVKRDTIYQYRRYGNIPVPDRQEGGRKPERGEMIRWGGRTATRNYSQGITTYQAPAERRPRPGELIHPTNIGWKAWKIYRWIKAERKGSGWHASGTDRKPYVARTRKVRPGEWVPPTTPPVVIPPNTVPT